MKLNLVKANICTIPDASRVYLSMLKEPFYFARYKGVLYINEDLSDMDKITAAVKKAWESVEADPTDESMEASDDAYDLVVELHGQEAAGQLARVFLNAAKEYRQQKSTEEARTWLETVYENLTEEQRWEMYKAGYRTRITTDGMWRAMVQMHDEGGNRYKEYISASADAAATYGFLLGMEYGKKMGGNGKGVEVSNL